MKIVPNGGVTLFEKTLFENNLFENEQLVDVVNLESSSQQFLTVGIIRKTEKTF